ncbi:MAG: hypothetical protein R2867_26180 [Caldilineaceae bacterium]
MKIALAQFLVSDLHPRDLGSQIVAANHHGVTKRNLPGWIAGRFHPVNGWQREWHRLHGIALNG